MYTLEDAPQLITSSKIDKDGLQRLGSADLVKM